MTLGPVRVGVVGAGSVSDEYLENLASFPDVDVIAIASKDGVTAQRQADRYGISRHGTFHQLLEWEEIELVVVLTPPSSHASLAEAALASGKHVYLEKPFAASLPEAEELIRFATACGLMVGCAPDTIFGPALSETRRAIASGRIGEPVAVDMRMEDPGPDAWHPDPAFLFARGAGPLFDIAPYYLTAAATLIAPFQSIIGIGAKAASSRTVAQGPRAGARFSVEVPTQVETVGRLVGGTTFRMLLSFDSPISSRSFQVTGTEGVVTLPSPTDFDGVVRHFSRSNNEWSTISTPPAVGTRGLGVLDMARSLRRGLVPAASTELAVHVLDVMLAAEQSMASGCMARVTSTFPLMPDRDVHATARQRTIE